MSFYEKIIYLINERGITQRQFTKELNLNSGAIQNWRRQGSKPRPETMAMISDYFGVDRTSLANDDMPLAFTDNENMEFQYKKEPALRQRVYSMEKSCRLTEDIIKKISTFMNVDFTFLINTSEKVFDPAMHSLKERSGIDFSVLYDIFALADSCAGDDLSRGVMTQISRVIMYRVKQVKKYKDDYKFWRDVIGINYDKVKYLLFHPTANADMNYGFNFSELLTIQCASQISIVYMLAEIGEPYSDYMNDVTAENRTLKEKISGSTGEKS